LASSPSTVSNGSSSLLGSHQTSVGGFHFLTSSTLHLSPFQGPKVVHVMLMQLKRLFQRLRDDVPIVFGFFLFHEPSGQFIGRPCPGFQRPRLSLVGDFLRPLDWVPHCVQF
jgi:hypothetical protein